MARPKKEGLEYFSHDVHAANDKKVEALRMLYGNDGYAFFFILLETIYQESDFELDVSDAETIQILCRKTELTIDRFNMILETAIKRECFDREAYEERGVLTSNGIKKRADVVVKKRVKMQESYREKVSAAETPPETRQNGGVSSPKGKESKRKVKAKQIKEEVIKTLYAEQVFLSDDEYQKLIEKYGTAENVKWGIDKLSNYKCSKATKYKSDYHVLIGWVYDEFEKKKLTVVPGGRYEQKTSTSKLQEIYAMAEEEERHAENRGYQAY